MCAETRERERDEVFFSVCLRSAQFDFFFHRARKSKKKVGRREESCSTVVTLFFLSLSYACVCSSSSPLVFFFCIYARIWRLQTYINASKSRKTEKKEKKIGGRKRMENTRTLLCFLNIDRRERERRRANYYRKKYSRRKKRETKSSGNVY
jgi:hypothetical protein